MARVIRALDLREPPPQYEFANGQRVQLAYLDAPGWLLLEAYIEQPTNLERLQALMAAIVPGVPFEAIDRVATQTDYATLIALAKGYAPELLEALGNGPRAVVSPAAARTPDPEPPPSSPTTPSPTSSDGSPKPTAGRSRKSGTSRGTTPSLPSTP